MNTSRYNHPKTDISHGLILQQNPYFSMVNSCLVKGQICCSRTPQLYVAIANPLFAAPGCTQQEAVGWLE